MSDPRYGGGASVGRAEISKSDRGRNITAGALVGAGGLYGTHVYGEYRERTNDLIRAKGKRGLADNALRQSQAAERRALAQRGGTDAVRQVAATDFDRAAAVSGPRRNIVLRPATDRFLSANAQHKTSVAAHDAAQGAVRSAAQRASDARKVVGEAKWARTRTGAKGAAAAGVAALGASVWGSDAWKERKGKLTPIRRRVRFRSAPEPDSRTALSAADRYPARAEGRRRAGQEGQRSMDAQGIRDAQRRRNGL